MNFEEKVVLVTGASRGIGRAVAQAFSSAGATVAVHYNQNRAAAEETLASLPEGSHHLFQADLRKPEEASDLVTAVSKHMRRIDILVNNAGIYEEHPITEASYDNWIEVWKNTLNVNLLGPASITFGVVRQMMKTGGGRIVNISSRGAFRGEPKAPAYGASKAGLNAMSQSLAVALAPYNIFVCVIAPGWVETDMASSSLSGSGGDAIRAQSPLGRVALPEEVAQTATFLASEGTEFLTGCIVDVNGASYLRS